MALAGLIINLSLEVRILYRREKKIVTLGAVWNRMDCLEKRWVHHHGRCTRIEWELIWQGFWGVYKSSSKIVSKQDMKCHHKLLSHSRTVFHHSASTFIEPFPDHKLCKPYRACKDDWENILCCWGIRKNGIATR